MLKMGISRGILESALGAGDLDRFEATFDKFLVNTLEKVALLKFSIPSFGYVSVLGSQIYPLRAFSAFWLTADEPQCPRMANMWRNRTLSRCEVCWAHPPGIPRER